MALTPTLAAYFKLEDLTDYLGVVTLTNNNAVTFASAKINNGADFENSAAEQATLSATNAGSAPLSFSTDFTVAGWVKFESLPSGGGLMTITSRRAGGNGYSVYYIEDGGNLKWQINIQGGSGQLTDNGISAGTFYHMAFVYTKNAGGGANDGTCQIYRNATSLGTITGLPDDLTAATSTFRLGSDNGTGELFDGILDELGFWSSALAGADITRLYNAGTGMQPPYEVSYSPSAETVTATDSMTHSSSTTFTDTVTATDSMTKRYGFGGNTSKSSSTWSNTTKSNN